MTPSVADFWHFVSLRQAAYWKHLRKDGPPYSDDPSIARYHFCNVYREADRGTIWFQQHRPRPKGDGVEALKPLLYAALTYRLVNRIQTFEAWVTHVGSLPSHHTSGDALFQFLSRRMAMGEKVFTGRHLNVGLRKYRTMLDWLSHDSGHNHSELAWTVYSAPRLEDVTRALIKVPAVGRFFGWQVTCDLMESGALQPEVAAQEWCYLGPGALNGIKAIPEYASYKPLEAARDLMRQAHLHVTAQPAFARPGGPWLLTPPSQAAPDVLMDLKNVEHALCEYARYVRARAAIGSTKGIGLEVKPWAR